MEKMLKLHTEVVMEFVKISDIIDKGLSISEENQFFYFNLKQSVKRYGQLRPILLSKDYEIIDGSKLFNILKELKYTSAYALFIESQYSKKQIYCEVNTLYSELESINFFKYLAEHVDIKNNCLPYKQEDLEGFVKLLSYNDSLLGKNGKNKKKLF